LCVVPALVVRHPRSLSMFLVTYRPPLVDFLVEQIGGGTLFFIRDKRFRYRLLPGWNLL
jgi:hypothetical protein